MDGLHGAWETQVQSSTAQSSLQLPETELPGPSVVCKRQPLMPLKNWYDTFSELIDGCSVDNDGKGWILSNFHQWKSLDDIELSDEISPKKMKAVRSAMSSTFSDFVLQREAFMRELVLVGIDVDSVTNTPLVPNFAQGFDALTTFVNSERLREYFSQLDCDKIYKFIMTLSSQFKQSDQVNHTDEILEEVERILVGENMHPDAIAEIMQRIVDFEELQSGLESCDELKRKEVKLLTGKLGDVFNKLKAVKQCKNTKARLLFEFMESQNFPTDGVNWVLDWLPKEISEADILNHLDRCDELSRKHCRMVKEKIREIYNLTEKTEIQIQVKPARDIFLEKVDSILRSRLDIVANAQTWILNNICSFRRLYELEGSDDLTKKQINYLKTALQDAFEQFRSVEPMTEDFEPQINCDVGEFFDLPSTSADFTFSEPNDEDAQFEDALEMLEELCPVTIIPLILFNLEKQEGYAVEKFTLSESGVENICNLGSKRDDEVPIFYNSLSHGIMIDFETLNKLRIECLGLFGPCEAVLQIVASLIPSESVEVFQDKFKSLATGLYLIDVNAVQHKFVIFRSENDADFDCVKKDSRAAHFLRYMSQLTKTVLLCSDDKYENRLASEEKEVAKSSRRSRYALKKHELQQEAIKLKFLDSMDKKPEMELFDRLFSTSAGLIATISEETEGSTKASFDGKMANLEELEPMVMTSEILDLDNICEPFKMQFVQTFHPQEYFAIEKEVESETHRNYHLSSQYIEEVVVISTALFFVKSTIYRVSRIVEDYLRFNPRKTNDVWSNRINFDKHSILKVFQEQDAHGIGNALTLVTEMRNSINKYLLWAALVHNQSLPIWIEDKGFYQTTWKELYWFAKTVYSVPSWYPEHTHTEKSIRYAMANVSKNLDLRNADEFLESSIRTFLDYACKLIEPFQEMPSFVTFCRKHQNDVVECYRRSTLSKFVVQKFNCLMNQRALAICENSPIQIRHIKLLDKMIENKQFSLNYKTMKLEPSKKSVKFFQLTPTRDEQQRLNLSSDALNVKNVNFLKSGQLEIPSHLVLHTAFSVDTGKILVILNEESRSDCSVFNYSSMKKPLCKMPFGKAVSESSFDCRNRILFLHSC